MDQIQLADCLNCSWSGTTMREAEAHAESRKHRVLHHFTTEFDRRSEATMIDDDLRAARLQAKEARKRA